MQPKINLNYNLIKAPENVIDYIIIHELCHFKIKRHSHRTNLSSRRLLHLKSLIRDHLHIENIAHIQAKAFSVENKTVAWIEVQKASGPVLGIISN